MKKNTLKIIIFLILFVIFANAFSASYTLYNLSNLSYAIALGIDVGQNAKFKITAQFAKTASLSPSNSSSEDSKNIVLVSGEADSIFSGLNLLNGYIGKELNLSHCSIIIFSEELAKNRYLLRNI